MSNKDSIHEQGPGGWDMEQLPGILQVTPDVGAYAESNQNRNDSGERGHLGKYGPTTFRHRHVYVLDVSTLVKPKELLPQYGFCHSNLQAEEAPVILRQR